jgi:glycosyltransferase involved in cell wall biosynthesis
MASTLFPFAPPTEDDFAVAELFVLKDKYRSRSRNYVSFEASMKISFIIHDVTAHAGSERAQSSLANALSARGESISIWSMYGQGKPSGFPLASGVKVSYGLKDPWPYFLDYPWLACIFAIHVIRLRPDWIVCTGANRLIVALLAAFVPGVKVAIWEHFPVSNSVTKPRGRLARIIASVVASRIITLTKSDQDLYATLYAPTGTVSRIPNIVHTPGPNGAVRRKEFLAMGRLSHEKGFDLLLESWSIASRQLCDWSLRIVGDGKMRDQLVQQAKTLGIENRVIFAPFSEDPFSLYSECGVFVLSSRFEGLPFVLIEAMTCGAACISFDCPNGPREVIRNGTNGLLVPAERVDVLASAMVKLGENPLLRQRLGIAAQKVSRPFSEPRIAARWHEVLYGPTPFAKKPVIPVVPARAVRPREAQRLSAHG